MKTPVHATNLTHPVNSSSFVKKKLQSVIVLSSQGICWYLPVSQHRCQPLSTVTHKPNNSRSPHQNNGTFLDCEKLERCESKIRESSVLDQTDYFSTFKELLVGVSFIVLSEDLSGIIVFIMWRLTVHQRFYSSGAINGYTNKLDLFFHNLWKVISSLFFIFAMLKERQPSESTTVVNSNKSHWFKGYTVAANIITVNLSFNIFFAPFLWNGAKKRFCGNKTMEVCIDLVNTYKDLRTTAERRAPHPPTHPNWKEWRRRKVTLK